MVNWLTGWQRRPAAKQFPPFHPPHLPGPSASTHLLAGELLPGPLLLALELPRGLSGRLLPGLLLLQLLSSSLR